MAVAGTLGPRLDRERFQWSSLAMLAPGLALMLVLFIGPVVYAFYIGFTNLALVGSRSRDYSFTGLENFTRMLGDYVFVKSSWLTIIFVVGSAIVGQTVLGMALAILLRNALEGEITDRQPLGLGGVGEPHPGQPGAQRSPARHAHACTR